MVLDVCVMVAFVNLMVLAETLPTPVMLPVTLTSVLEVVVPNPAPAAVIIVLESLP